MKKSQYLWLFSMLCLAGLIVTGLKYVQVQNNSKQLQNSVDDAFRYQLNRVFDSFSMKVSDYTYRDMLANVLSAAQMSELTTYGDKNDELDVCLHNLYLSLREEKSKDMTLSNIDELREIFSLLVRDPASTTATDQLSLLTQETFFNVKD